MNIIDFLISGSILDSGCGVTHVLTHSSQAVHKTSERLIRSSLFRSFKRAKADSLLSLDQLKRSAENTSIWHFKYYNSTNRTDLA